MCIMLMQCAGPQGPGPLTSDSVAISLFVDLHLAHARQELGYIAPGREEILAQYGIDSTGFAQVMEYYAHHPEEYAALYSHVISRLGADEMRGLRRGY